MAKISLLGSGQQKASSGSVPEEMFIPRACDGKSLADLPLERVHPDPQQPRTWTEDELDDLLGKIEGAGKILQPITVIPRADMPGHYLIKTGEGRWRCAGRLGWKFVPAVIEDISVNSDDRQFFADQILENIGRVGMNPMDIASSIERYMNAFEPPITGKKASMMLGINETQISRYRKLLTAPDEIKEITGNISNINTLCYLIELSKINKEEYRVNLDKIKSGEINGAEKHLKELVNKIKKPESNEPKVIKEKRTDAKRSNKTELPADDDVLPPSMIEGLWDESVASEVENVDFTSKVRGAECNGVALIKVMQANGDEITLKLDCENQIKLRWLINKCLDK